MTFHVNAISRCSASGNHYTVNVSITNGPQNVDIPVNRDDMLVDFSSWEEARNAGIDRLRSAIKEANAVTWAQIQTALVGKDFKL